MGLMDFFKRKKTTRNDLATAAKKDFDIWQVLTTSMVTNKDFIAKYPPSDECCNIYEHCDWMLAALLTYRFILATEDKKHAESVIKIFNSLVDEYDSKKTRQLSEKVDTLYSLYSSVCQDEEGDISRNIENILRRINSEYLPFVIGWVFCREFMKKTTFDPDNRVDYNAAADYLFYQLTSYVMASETMKLCAPR